MPVAVFIDTHKLLWAVKRPNEHFFQTVERILRAGLKVESQKDIAA